MPASGGGEELTTLDDVAAVLGGGRGLLEVDCLIPTGSVQVRGAVTACSGFPGEARW